MFKDEIVLVTGSSRGIGKAIATAFAKEGATVILNAAHNETALMTTFEEFKEAGYSCLPFFGDVSCYETCQKLFEAILAHYKTSPSIIINNAGISYVDLFTETSPACFEKIMHTNVTSAYNCSYLAVPSMIQNHKGVIINITSIWGEVGASMEVAYSTSKAALNGLTKALSKELGPSNIRVNAVSCGWIDTDMTKHYTEEEKEAFTQDIPLCRTGSPSDISGTCLFIASDAASYMTGQIITLDGGML